MCGIAFTTKPSHIQAMLAAMYHRGTSSNYKIVDNNICLGHVRLPIQGLSNKYQGPYRYKNTEVCYAGEIYNYKDLTPGAESDVEALCHYWDIFGMLNAFEHFDAMYSIIAYNYDVQSLFIFTDHLGKKPLYLHLDTNSVASEIKALLQLPFRFTYNTYYFAQIAKWGYSPSYMTPFTEIVKLREGQCRIIDRDGRVQVHSLPVYQGKNTIEQAVINRTVSDIPFGLLCSGGLDSSIIYALLKKQGINPAAIFHIQNDIETPFLKELIGETTPYISVSYTQDDVDRDLESILLSNESPVDLGSMIPQWYLFKAANENNIHVMLSGDGADEVFGGYRRMREYDAQLSDIYDELIYYHLPRLDKMSMAHTVELRNPFLADSVVELGLSLDYSERIDKKFLKRQFKNYIPESILNREKYPMKSKYITELKDSWRLFLIQKFKETFCKYFPNVKGA